MTRAQTLRFLLTHHACTSAVEWCKAHEWETLDKLWSIADRADWMMWLVEKLDGTYSPRLRLAACACAPTALQYLAALDAERAAEGAAVWAAARAVALRETADIVRGIIPIPETRGKRNDQRRNRSGNQVHRA